jgi:hypothetical protein
MASNRVGCLAVALLVLGGALAMPGVAGATSRHHGHPTAVDLGRNVKVFD